jgi:O-antigen ligase
MSDPADDLGKRRPLNRLPALILVVAVAGAPFPFGSRDATTVALWSLVLAIGLLLASPRQLRGGHYRLLTGIAVIVACWALVLHEQLADHPWIAPPNPIWVRASELLKMQLTPSVSVIRGEPFYALGAPLANALALALGLIVGADRESANRTLKVMAWAGAGYAIYGIANLLVFPTAFLWRERTGDLGTLTATFVNRNTAAAYFGSCAVVWLVLAMARVRARLPPGPIEWKKLGRNVYPESRGDPQIILRFVMFFICLSAMFMTGSRGGVLASLFAMLIAAVVFFRSDLPRLTSLLIVVAGFAVVALGLLQILGGNVQARIDAGGLVEQGRLEAYRSTLRMIADDPWFGTGLGTFAAAFPPYRSANVSIVGIWDIAHSTPLEIAAEMGVPLALVTAVGWIVALLVLLRGTRRSRRETVVPHAALAVSLIALLHSSIDFSLQVAGYAIVVFAVAGIGLAQSVSTAPSRRTTRSTSWMSAGPANQGVDAS